MLKTGHGLRKVNNKTRIIQIPPKGQTGHDEVASYQKRGEIEFFTGQLQAPSSLANNLSSPLHMTGPPALSYVMIKNSKGQKTLVLDVTRHISSHRQFIIDRILKEIGKLMNRNNGMGIDRI